MKTGLVSIISPCYNMGKYIHRLLDSVLSQDYNQIAMLVIDDGSTDNSKDVIESYIPQFKKRGYILEYEFQENSGQSFAINKALKWVDGEYLVWPDSDDWFSSEHTISKMVEECSKSKEIGLVRVLYSIYDDKEHLINRMQITPNLLSEDQFETCVCHFSGSFVAGACMVRMDVFDECNPSREIYTEKMAGQNGSLMFPVLYKHRCVTIPEYLYAILEHSDSHSRGQVTYQKASAVVRGYHDLSLATLDKIIGLPEEERITLKSKVSKHYLPELFSLAVAAGEKKDAIILRQQLENLGAFDISFFWRIRYHLCKFGWFQSCVKRIGRLSRLFSGV